MRIATFNLQNLRLRQRAGLAHLDGARDDDVPTETGSAAEALDEDDRRLSARLIALANADVIALQEVFDQSSLDYFHETFLAPLGARFPHRVCLEGNDGRSADVALLSRVALTDIESNAALTYEQIGAEPPPGASASSRVFRRDCLAARCGAYWLFACHFKAGDDAVAHIVRRAEALAVRFIVERKISSRSDANWVALGDFNTHDDKSYSDLAELSGPFGVDLCECIPEDERWTYYQLDAQRYSCPDRLIVAPALAAANPQAHLRALRHGMSRLADRYVGPRFEDVGPRRPRASDHALLFVDLEPSS